MCHFMSLHSVKFTEKIKDFRRLRTWLLSIFRQFKCTYAVCVLHKPKLVCGNEGLAIDKRNGYRQLERCSVTVPRMKLVK
jgi:hypothetical protein